jgi:hypothetical protein
MDGESQEQLVSKIQYKNFEPGEFIDRQERTCAQTIALIEQFPWETERDHLVVSLTNPSITIEGPGGDYLKLALYYNGKFVLHYLDQKHHLYTKSLPKYQDAFPIIQSFFANTPFDPQELKQEASLLQERLPHFADGNFQYRISTGRTLWFGFPFLFILPLMLLVDIVLLIKKNTSQPGSIIFLTVFILLLSGIFILQLFNHYWYSRNLVLTMTKGNDLFYFGPSEHPKAFNKKDILNLTTHGSRGRGGSFEGNLLREEINFTDGRSINISTILIGHGLLLDKLPGIPLKEEREFFPFLSIPPSAAIPS